MAIQLYECPIEAAVCKKRSGIGRALLCSVLLPMASLVMGEQVAGDATIMLPVPLPSAALLESADGQIIGSVTGRVLARDEHGTLLGAYGVLSRRGYFAELLPSGDLAQVDSLVYEQPDCAGLPAIEVTAGGGQAPPLPAYVFAFGAPAHVWLVPDGARARAFAIASRREHTAAGDFCRDVSQQATAFPLVVNRSDTSGIGNAYRAPLRVHVSTRSATPNAPITRGAGGLETGAGAPLDDTTPQCAAGCFIPYLGDGICEAECANSLCDFDASDCSAAFVTHARQREAALCAPTCDSTDLGDGFCDQRCNVAACEFDHGDCQPR